jgi:hypothetical protein
MVAVAPMRRLLENGFKETETQVCILVADLVEGMWAQQRDAIGIKQSISQYVTKGKHPSTSACTLTPLVSLSPPFLHCNQIQIQI